MMRGDTPIRGQHSDWVAVQEIKEQVFAEFRAARLEKEAEQEAARIARFNYSLKP